MNESELLNKLKSREQDSLRIAVERYSSMLYKVALGFTHDKQEADDIVQEVFIKLWENAPKLELKNTKLSTWLYRVTVNYAINLTRRNKFKSLFEDLSQFTRKSDDGTIEFQIEDTQNKNPAEQTENKELGEIIKIAINSLPKKQKIAFILTKYRGLSSKEVAEIMEISPGNVDILVHRAKKALQKKILNLTKH